MQVYFYLIMLIYYLLFRNKYCLFCQNELTLKVYFCHDMTNGGIKMDGFKNIMEEAVVYQLNKILPTMPNICSCEDCKLDMITYALNRLRPQYVRTDTGALFQKLNNSSPQAEVEILATVISAINTIGAHPHHQK